MSLNDLFRDGAIEMNSNAAYCKMQHLASTDESLYEKM